MMKRIRYHLMLVLLAGLCSLFAVTPCRAVETPEIKGLKVTITDTALSVGLSLALDNNQLSLIKEGMHKEYAFYVDLFRHWDVFPDEFVKGIKVLRTIIADSVKGEFKVISETDTTILEKRFTSFDSMLKWGLSVDNVDFLLADLPADGSYFIRITVESIKQKPPQMLRYIFFFVDDRDFKIRIDSTPFRLKRG